jgi:predicted RNase H-like nuclease (RuvC/YqgF family)
MAEDVAQEYSALDRSARAETSKLKDKAAKRLDTLKKTQERESGLREQLDLVKETYENQLAAAQAEITKLKDELGEKALVICGLEKEVETARKEIKV